MEHVFSVVVQDLWCYNNTVITENERDLQEGEFYAYRNRL